MTSQEFLVQLVEAPLYKKFPCASTDLSNVARSIRVHEQRFDLYCPLCGKDSTWKLIVSEETSKRYKLEKASAGHFGGGASTIRWDGKFQLITQCSRDPSHIATYYLDTGKLSNKSATKPKHGDSVKDVTAETTPQEAERSFIQKVGQTPSLFDFQKTVLGSLSAGLTKEQANDFVRAIQTHSHGYHVASCVYLRRVFESMLDAAKVHHMEAHELTKWDEYDSGKTSQKIQLLKQYLPDFLVDHPHLYTLLSLGVHELSEQQCSEEFENLRTAIDIIIREQIADANERKRKVEISTLLSKSINQRKNKK